MEIYHQSRDLQYHQGLLDLLRQHPVHLVLHLHLYSDHRRKCCNCITESFCIRNTWQQSFQKILDNNMNEKYIDPKYNAWYPLWNPLYQPYLMNAFVTQRCMLNLRNYTTNVTSTSRISYYNSLFSGVLSLLPLGLTVSKIFQGFLALIIAVIVVSNKMMRSKNVRTSTDWPVINT